MSASKDLDELLRRFEAGELEQDRSKLDCLAGRDLFLYGAGNVGKRLYHSLSLNGIEVSGFLDRNPDICLPDIPVRVFPPNSPELESRRASCTVILSGLFSVQTCNEIKAHLDLLGFRQVYALHEVSYNELNSGSFREGLFDDSYNKVDILGADRKRLERAFDLLEGDADRKLFLSYLNAHLTMDFTRLEAPHDIALQYLAHDINCTKDYSRFIDCGGFDGDTYRQLTEYGCLIESLAAFEPQGDQYTKYAETLRGSPSPPKQAFLFPCGVYSETAQLRFAAPEEGKTAAKVSSIGEELIQCVKLDDALQGFAPTFIKMDIEGAETAALRGARGLITEHGPGLAICVYHGISDLWEVPNLIADMRDDYRYYLRSYNYMGLETVLYALPVACHVNAR